MNREELVEMIRRGPVRLTMSDWRTFTIRSLNSVIVSSTSVVLLACDDHGKLRSMRLAIPAIIAAERDDSR